MNWLKQPLVRLGLVVLVLAALVVSQSRFTAQERERDDSLRLWFLDVGQGDAILIDTPDQHQILVDGGPDSSVLGEISKALPLTDKEIDLVISTHNDADHLSGLNSVLEHYKVDRVWLTGAVHTTQTYQKFLNLIRTKNIPTTIISGGEKVEYGELQGIAIWPLENWAGRTPSEQNAPGIVTYWQYGQKTFLLTGDVAAEQERAMLSRGALRPVEILKVAHHGSKTSTTPEFLAAVTPKVAVISVGKNNRYGHPTSEVLGRLGALAIPILRTDQSGTIKFSLWPDRYSYTAVK